MKRILIILAISILSLPSVAQLHYSGSWNMEAGAGINDMKCFSPVIGVGYTFSGTIAAYGRYTLALGSQPGFEFKEHNIELLVSFTPLSIREDFFVNLNIGPVVKFQNFGDFKPTPRTGAVNVGGAADIDLEFSIGTYWSLFGRGTYRMLLADEHTRHELFYSAGVRVSMNIINAAERRLLRPSKRRR